MTSYWTGRNMAARAAGQRSQQQAWHFANGIRCHMCCADTAMVPVGLPLIRKSQCNPTQKTPRQYIPCSQACQSNTSQHCRSCQWHQPPAAAMFVECFISVPAACRCSCCSWWVKLLPERFQEPPSWWWHLSRIQRNSIRISAISLSLLLLALSILGIAYSVHSSSSSSSNSSSSSSSSDSSSIPAAGRAGYQPQHVTADSSPLCSWDNLYLPKAVQPSQYKLHIKTNMQEPYLVEGEVQITVQTAEATPCVVLHSKDIDIHSVKLLIFSADSDIDDQQPVEVPGEMLQMVGVISSSFNDTQQQQSGIATNRPVEVRVEPPQTTLVLSRDNCCDTNRQNSCES